MDIKLTYDQWLSALTLWREARGQSLACLTAIYHVILNRRKDLKYRWSRSIPGVILQHHQFSCWNLGDPNVNKCPIPPPSGTNPSPDWKAWLDCCIVVSTDLAADPTSGATNYESTPPDKRPNWIVGATLTAEIGPFRFYILP